MADTDQLDLEGKAKPSEEKSCMNCKFPEYSDTAEALSYHDRCSDCSPLNHDYKGWIGLIPQSILESWAKDMEA